MNIIVTGASRGIGRALVKTLAEHNYNIIVIARSEKELNNLKSECKLINPKSEIFPIHFDLSQSTEIGKKLIPEIKKTFKKLDILINNAGYLKNTSFSELTPELLKAHYEVNFFSSFELIRQSLELMKDSDIKHIVNIGTMGAVQNRKKYSGLSAYTSGKAALANLTELLPEELKSMAIRINYLALGAVETAMFQEAFPGKKASLTPEEIAIHIKHFAQNGWKYYNGKIIPVAS